MGVWAHPNITHFRVDEQIRDAPELCNERPVDKREGAEVQPNLKKEQNRPSSRLN